MIVKVSPPGNDFGGGAHYLVHGKRDRLDPERVDWIESRNLPTHDAKAAARIMRATARDSDSVQKPVYLLSVSFDPNDPVNRETMRKVADRTLRDLGLQDHQALIVAHRDRAHPHFHIMVNRVHPEQHKVWSNWSDYRRIERSLRQQEVELGLRVVPGRHAPVPEHARTGAERPAPRLERGDAAFVERARREAGPHLAGARSWAELERGLAEHGLSVRVEGRGLVVTDGVQKAKASDIDRAVSRANVERRLGPLGEYRARQAVAGRTLDEHAAQHVDRAPRAPQVQQQRTPQRVPPQQRDVAARTMAEPAPVERVRHPQQPKLAAPERTAPAPADPFFRPPPTHREAARGFSRELRALYADPRAARQAFVEAAQRRGPERAASALGTEPHRFGALRPGADPARSRHAAEAGYDYARQQGTGERPALKQSARLLREADAFEQSERRLARAVEISRTAPRGSAQAAEAARALEVARAAHARLTPVNVQGHVREAAARLMSAQIGKAPEVAAKLAQRLAPMIPATATGLARTAFQIGKEMALGHDPARERQHVRSRGLSL